MKNHIKKLIRNLEIAMNVIEDEYGITQEEIDNKGKGCGLNRGNSIYSQLKNMQEDIKAAKKAVD